MGRPLNSKIFQREGNKHGKYFKLGQLKLFRGRFEGSYFVDKSEILIKLNKVIGKVDE